MAQLLFSIRVQERRPAQAFQTGFRRAPGNAMAGLLFQIPAVGAADPGIGTEKKEGNLRRVLRETCWVSASPAPVRGVLFFRISRRNNRIQPIPSRTRPATVSSHVPSSSDSPDRLKSLL